MQRLFLPLVVLACAIVARTEEPARQVPKAQGNFVPSRTVPDGKHFQSLKSGPCSVQCLKNFAEAMYPTAADSYLAAAKTGKPVGPAEYVRYLIHLYLHSGPGKEGPQRLPQFIGEKADMALHDPSTQLAIAKAFEELIYGSENFDRLVEVSGAEKEAWWRAYSRFERRSHDAAVAEHEAVALVDEAALKKRIKARGGYEIFYGMRSFRQDSYRVYKKPDERDLARFKGYRGTHVVLATLGPGDSILFYDFRTRPGVAAQAAGIEPRFFKASGRLAASYLVDTVEMSEPWRETRLHEEFVRLIPFTEILGPMVKDKVGDQMRWVVKNR
jgi:hypothetical protein